MMFPSRASAKNWELPLMDAQSPNLAGSQGRRMSSANQRSHSILTVRTSAMRAYPFCATRQTKEAHNQFSIRRGRRSSGNRASLFASGPHGNGFIQSAFPALRPPRCSTPPLFRCAPIRLEMRMSSGGRNCRDIKGDMRHIARMRV
jgi:hypothetical protein